MRWTLATCALVATGCNAVFGLDPVALGDRPAVVSLDLVAPPAALVAGRLSPSGPIELVMTTGTNLVIVTHNQTQTPGVPVFDLAPLALPATTPWRADAVDVALAAALAAGAEVAPGPGIAIDDAALAGFAPA